jgi:hypothetical protein
LATTVSETVWDTPASVAVKVADWLVETVPVWAVKLAVREPWATVADARTDTAELLLAKDTAVPVW